MTRNKVVLIVVVFLIGVVIACCSKSNSEDKFVGAWYKDGVKSDEISKDGNKYNWQTYYEDGRKGADYEDGFISEGYLLFNRSTKKYRGFEYKSEKEILSVTFYKPDSKSKPSECEKEEDWVLTRGK